MNGSHIAQNPHRSPKEREELARQLRDPYRTRVLCIHRIRRAGYCTDCGERVQKVKS